jgi:copper chaperone CopZ
MHRILGILAASVVAAAAVDSFAAETKVVMTKTHVCCPRCETVVGEVLKKAGVTGSASKQEKSITFTAADDAAAQKVIDELAAAGFHGVIDSKTLSVKDDSGAKAGNVTTLKLKGLHNCCGQCNTAIKKAIKSVAGTESDDAKANSMTVTVKGDFDAKALVKSLSDAGFHATVSE